MILETLAAALQGAAVLNALALRHGPHWRWLGVTAGAPHQRAWRMHGLLSVLLWLGVITAGRLIGYQ